MILMMKKDRKRGEIHSVYRGSGSEPGEMVWKKSNRIRGTGRSPESMTFVSWIPFEGMVNRLMAREDIGTLYFDCYRYQVEDLPDYNMVKAEEFAKEISRQTD